MNTRSLVDHIEDMLCWHRGDGGLRYDIYSDEVESAILGEVACLLNQ